MSLSPADRQRAARIARPFALCFLLGLVTGFALAVALGLSWLLWGPEVDASDTAYRPAVEQWDQTNYLRDTALETERIRRDRERAELESSSE